MDRNSFNELMSQCCVCSKVTAFERNVGGGEKFFATAYCLLDGNDYDEQCALFIEKFSRVTSTNWISLKRIDSCVRYKFRKSFACQFSKKNKKTYGRSYVNKIRDKECMARVHFKWKHVNKSTIRNDPNLHSGLNCIVSICFDHTHSQTSIDTLSFLRASKDTTERFYSYFELGLSPSEAKAYHEIYILDGLINEHLISLHLSNTQTNPSLRQVIYMHDTWAAKGKPDAESDSYEKLTTLAETLKKQGTHMNVDKDTLTLAIVTPLMERVYTKFISLEDKLTVWIEDSETKYNSTRLFPTLFFVSSKVGALPIGCVIHKLANTEIAFRLLKETLEKCSNQPFPPSVIIAGDDIVQRIPQQLVFRGSTNLIGVTKFLQNMWKWLGFSKNTLKSLDKKTAMRSFKEIVFSQTVESATEKQRNLCSSMKEFPVLVKHLEFMWFRRNEWCLPFRKDLPKAATNFENCETSIRILKDTLLYHCKSFNVYAMINVICNSLEKYNIDRLSRACSVGIQDLSPHFAKYTKQMQKGIQLGSNSENEQQFVQSNGKVVCTVYTDIAVCDCVAGRTGRFCEHLGVVSEDLLNSPEILPEDVTLFDQLITGLKLKQESSQPSTSQELFPSFYIQNYKSGEMETNDVHVGLDTCSSGDEDDHTDAQSSPDQEVFYIQNFKPEEMEINDVRMGPDPCSSEEEDGHADDSHSIDDIAETSTPSETHIKEETPEVPEEVLITEHFKQEEIYINEDNVTSKPSSSGEGDSINENPFISDKTTTPTETQGEEEAPPKATEEILLIENYIKDEDNILKPNFLPEDNLADDISYLPKITSDIKEDEKVPEEKIITDDFNAEGIETNGFMEPIANFFEDVTEPRNDLFSNIELIRAEAVYQVPVNNHHLNEAPLIPPTGVALVHCVPVPGSSSTSGDLSSSTNLTDAIKEELGHIGDLISVNYLGPRVLQDFYDVLKEITTPAQAKVFCQEVTRFKKLKRLGFKLPTLSEQRKKASVKLGKFRTY